MNIIIVNENDEVIGIKPRDQKKPEDIGRVSALVVFNTRGETLIAQRAFSKKTDPGQWGPAVAGTVEEGETYISNIIKEAEEEIGLRITESDLKVLSHSHTKRDYGYFSTVFSVTVDRDISEFKIQREEVEAIRWIGKDELALWMESKPLDFIPSFTKYLNYFDMK